MRDLPLNETARSNESAPSKTRFLRNVVWSWTGVAINVLIGLFLSPILVRKLGVAQYGVWVIVFSVMDYLRLLDFGLRSAVINRCARYQARREWPGVNVTIGTAVVYFLAMSAVCCVVAVLGRDMAMSLFQIDPPFHDDARLLLVIIAASISARLIFSPVTAALEAFQRFDLINRAYIASLSVRAVGSLALLLAGYGLVPLGWLVLAVGVGEDLWNLFSLKRIFPELRLSPRLIRREAFAELIGYGKHSAAMTVANMAELQAPSTVLGLMRGPTDVAFFALPWRLLLYTTEAFAKVGQITASVTAELDESRQTPRVWHMAVATNRMCLALFMPVAIFLCVYATPLLTVWVSPEVGRNSGPLLPVLVMPFLFAIAGQFNAGSVLMGQARHRVYAWSIVLEVIVMTAALFVASRRYGAYGVAWVVATSITAVRGVFLAVLMCRVNGFALSGYLRAIYLSPLATGAPVIALAIVLRMTVLPGHNWPELLGAAAIVASAYFVLGFFIVLDGASRGQIVASIPGSHRLFSRFA
jgi:O-antigen/teichoic acid export membrane protein